MFYFHVINIAHINNEIISLVQSGLENLYRLMSSSYCCDKVYVILMIIGQS